MGTHTEIENTIIRNCITENVRGRVQRMNTTPQRIPNYGLTLLGATGAVTMIMDAPAEGSSKRLIKNTTSTAVLTITGPTTTVTFNATGNTNLAFDAADDFIELYGASSTRWVVISNTSVSLS